MEVNMGYNKFTISKPAKVFFEDNAFFVIII